MRALIDTEFYLYRCAAGAEFEVDWGDDDWTYACRHSDAVIAFDEQLADLLEALPGFQPALAFGDRASFRYGLWPGYKHSRRKLRKPAGYRQLLGWVKTAAAARGWQVLELPQVEGDDVLGISYREGDVIVSGDKDMATLPGLHLKDGHVERIATRDADLAFYGQALTGDATDGYPGIKGFGPVAASKALAGLLTERDMWQAVLTAYEKKGHDQRYAITMARCARILRAGEYDHDKGIPVLWEPPVI